MKSIYIIDPYYADSHQYWAESLKHNISGTVEIFSMSPVHWKWKMEGAAIVLAKKVVEQKVIPDIFLVTDFLNLALFKSLLPLEFQQCQMVLYMHENQLTYPISKRDTDQIQTRDNHYGFINYTSCLIAETVIFNSSFHKRSFLDALSKLSKKLPDNLDVKHIESKSIVIPLTLDLEAFDDLQKRGPKNDIKTIVWNHRWEYDKRLDLFFNGLLELKSDGILFELILLGKADEKMLEAHSYSLEQLSDQIRHIGYASSKETYYDYLHQADIIVSTSEHDFFGVSVLEAMYAGCRPVLPNDLAYPELVPRVLHDDLLYEKNHFTHSLRTALQEEWSDTSRKMLRSHIKENFSWKKVGARYLQSFNQTSLEINRK